MFISEIYMASTWNIRIKRQKYNVSGRNFLQIFKINNNKFELKQDFYSYNFAELLDIYQLENEKILVNSILGTLYLIIKKQGKYEIIKEIKVERRKHSIENIGENKIILIESFYDYTDFLHPCLTHSNISILDFNGENVDKKIIDTKCKISLNPFAKSIFNLNNGFLFILSENNIFVFILKYQEIIQIYEMENFLIDIICYKDDEYLCIFADNKVALASFKSEFIIKETKEYNKNELKPLRFIIVNEKICLYCDEVDERDKYRVNY